MTKNEALKMAIEALSQDEGWFEPEAAIKACKEALESQEKEPSFFGWYDNHDIHYEKQTDDSIPLYTNHAQPLSDDEIWDILFKIKGDSDGHMAHNFARAIEQAHGIGLKKE